MSDEKRTWYQRTHQFTPYTKADGTAVSDEFDAIQASFERIPEMRDDGKGFKESPLIPAPTDPMHPVPFKMLTETEKSVNNARDDVTVKAQQVAQNTQSVEANTLIATQKANTATQAAVSAQSSQQAASNSENMAHKWAANPVNEVVQGDKYSSYHYATKAEQSATTASSAAVTSRSNADIATSKAEEAVQAANRATSLANGEVDYSKVINVPSANTKTKGIVQLTSSIESDSEELGLTAKVGKYLASLIAKIPELLVGYIEISSMSSSVDSDSAKNVATSAAVKAANDNANERVSKSGDTMTGNLTVPNIMVNDPTNNNNSVQIGDDTKLIDVDMGHTVGLQATDNANDAYIAYGATKKRFGFDGVNFSAESGLGAQWFGSQKRGEGAYVNQWQTDAPYQVYAGNANGSNTYFPYLKGKVANGDGWGTAFSFGYTTPGARNQFGVGIIHLIEDNGTERKWEFEHNGDFISNGDIRTSSRSLNKTHQTDFAFVRTAQDNNYLGGLEVLRKDSNKLARFEFNHNRWKMWVQDAYEILFPERGGVVALAHETVSDVRLGTGMLKAETDSVPGMGYVLVGVKVFQDNTRTLFYRPIQKLVNGNWYNVISI